MLPHEYMDRAAALPGMILVQRARSGYYWQGIIQLPDTYTHGTKNANARIHDIGNIPVDGSTLITDLQIGDQVFLAPGVSRVISFKEAPPEERDKEYEPKLYACYPGEIMGIFLPDGNEEITLTPHPMGPPRELSEAELEAADRPDETF